MTKLTTAECIEWIDRQLENWSHGTPSKVFMASIRAQLIAADELKAENAEFERLLAKYMKRDDAAQEMAKALGNAISQLGETSVPGDDEKDNMAAVDLALKALRNYHESGGQ